MALRCRECKTKLRRVGSEPGVYLDEICQRYIVIEKVRSNDVENPFLQRKIEYRDTRDRRCTKIVPIEDVEKEISKILFENGTGVKVFRLTWIEEQ